MSIPMKHFRLFLMLTTLITVLLPHSALGGTVNAGEISPPTEVRAVLTDAGAAGIAAEVSFLPSDEFPGDSFLVTVSPGGTTAAGISSPISLPGLDPDTVYTFTVTAYSESDSVVSDPSPQAYFGDDRAKAFSTLPLSGFNADLIANGFATVTSSTSIGFDDLGRVFYAKAFSGENASGMTNLIRGLPDDGLIISATLPQGHYQLEDYSGGNALYLPGVSSGTLTLERPAAYNRLSFLTSSCNGDSTLSITLNFAHGLPTTFTGYSIHDWYEGNNYVIKGTGRVSRLTETGDEEKGSNPRLYDAFITLSREDARRVIESISFIKSSGGARAAVFAISGEKGRSSYNQPAIATEPRIVNTLKYLIGSTDYYLSLASAPEVLRPMDAAPVLNGDRTLLPIRYVIEPMGGSIFWDQQKKKIAIKRGDTLIELWIGSNTARVNGADQLIDAENPDIQPIIIAPGRTLLPLRFIAEALGCTVDWDPAMQEILITDW
jgi:hypothetical protein